MTFKQFLLKKYPPLKYVDCPVPKKYWPVAEEYAAAANARVKEFEAGLQVIQSDHFFKEYMKDGRIDRIIDHLLNKKA